jgi:hypothetical protein
MVQQIDPVDIKSLSEEIIFLRLQTSGEYVLRRWAFTPQNQFLID